LTDWNSADTGLDTVIGQLGRLRRSAGASRAAVMNLVILAAGDAGADRAVDSVIGLGHHHPGRIIVVVPRRERSDPDRMAASVGVHSDQVEDRAVWWDVVRLEVGGAMLANSASLVDPLLLHDLPVAVWLVGGTSRIESPALVSMADQIVVSGERAASVSPSAAASDLSGLAARRPVADLAWVAIEPARQVLARLFDPPTPPGAARSITSLAVEGPPWSSRLLAAWICERAGLDPAAVEWSPSEVLRARIGLEGETVELDAGPVWPAGADHQVGPEPKAAEPGPVRERAPGAGPGVATARGFGRRSSVRHGGSGTPRLLTAALARPHRDRRYEAAIPLAGRLGA
jgi:glucose-6-phosphate dehydrogenase assembly protein OpcA